MVCTLWSVSLDNIQGFEAEVTCLFVKSVRQCCLAFCLNDTIGVTPLAFAEEPRIFRIGTGDIGGTYYPIGGIIASAISSPPGARLCDKGGSCVARIGRDREDIRWSVANVEFAREPFFRVEFRAIRCLHTGLIRVWELFASAKHRNPFARSLTSTQSFPVVVRDGSKFSVIRDLKGRRVSLDEKEASALVDARLVLRAFGLREWRDFKLRYFLGDVASAQLVAGKLDAFIIVAGCPVPSVVRAVEEEMHGS